MPTITKRVSAQIAAMAVVFAAFLFVPAGTLRWPAAFVFLALMFGFTIALTAWLMHADPALLNERMTGVGKRDQKGWDKALLALLGLCFFLWLAVMGVDRRLDLSQVPVWLSIAGALILILSFSMFYWTFRENTYLSPAVRVQTDRAQRVVSTGPYAFVRHPMYAAFVLYATGTSLLLGSWLGMLGAAVLVVLTALRALLEERVLSAELDGYREYMKRVRWRFIPLVW